MTEQHTTPLHPDTELETDTGTISNENYQQVLEDEIIRRIHIIESPTYKGVKRFSKADTICALGLAGIMFILVILGARL